MIFDSAALSPQGGTNTRRTGSGEPSPLSNQTSLEIDHKLQKALCVAIEQLGMLWRFRRDLKRSAQIRADIGAVARWINFLIDQREYIAVEIIEQRPDLVELGGRSYARRAERVQRMATAKPAATRVRHHLLSGKHN